MAEETFYLVVRVCSWIIVAFSFLVGLGLLLVPKVIAKLSRSFNRSFPTDALEKALEKPIEADKWIVGHRIVVGMVALVISIVIFIQLMVK